MVYNAALIKYVEEHADLINTNSFTELYNGVNDILTACELTQVLLDANIDPLPYMTSIVPEMYQFLYIPELDIPSNITSIEAAAFHSCMKLKAVSIPKSVTRIGIAAFQACRQLSDVKFDPNSKLSIIESSAFTFCDSLAYITIPNGVKEIEYNAFNDHISISYDGTKEKWDKIKGAQYYPIDSITFLK